jgi:non-ribosomal peptide synthetase-like protein
LIDAIRVILPNFISLAGTVAFFGFLYFSITRYGFINTALVSPFALILSTMASAITVPIIKQLVMGTFKPEIKPLWCTYIWWNEMVNGLFETIGAPLMAPMQGTPFYNWYFRLMGCKIGKYTYIGSSHFSEWDLVEIGDYCAINSGMIPQNHLFEDRIFKSSTIKIEDECSIGHLSVVLYDTHLKARSKIESMSLVMKGESLPIESTWEGIPIQRG